MTIRIRTKTGERELADIQSVRKALADGDLEIDDVLWDPVGERWVGVLDALRGSGEAQTTSSPPAAAPGGSKTAASPPLASASSGRPWWARRRLWVVAGAGIVVLIVLLAFLLFFGTDYAKLNRQTIEERAAQDQGIREKGESFVADTYRLRWQDDPDDPMAIYLYVRGSNPENAEQLLIECVTEHPPYAWCAHALSWRYREEGKWREALRHAEQAAAAFGSADILSNRDFLVAASGRNYSRWSGERRTRVECGQIDTDRIGSADRDAAESGRRNVPPGLLLLADHVADIREKAVGFDCPEICSDAEAVALCYDVEWRGENTPQEIRLRLDNGDTVDATLHAADAPNQGVAVACVPTDREVVSVTQLFAGHSQTGSGTGCSDGELREGPPAPQSLDQLASHWREKTRVALQACRHECERSAAAGGAAEAAARRQRMSVENYCELSCGFGFGGMR